MPHDIDENNDSHDAGKNVCSKEPIDIHSVSDFSITILKTKKPIEQAAPTISPYFIIPRK